MLPSTQWSMWRSPAARRRHAAATGPGELEAHGCAGAQRVAMREDAAGAEHIPTHVAVRHAFDVRATYEELSAVRTGREALHRGRAERRQRQQQQDPTDRASSQHGGNIRSETSTRSPPCAGQGWVV